MRFLITAGGTREYLDPVRFISNASSGMMGYALVRAALAAGHKVTLITAPTALRPPKGAKLVPVRSAAGMFHAVKEHFPKCDCLVMAAAVSDYTPARPRRTKIRRQTGNLMLELKPTPDILQWAARHKRSGQTLVGFALEDKDVRVHAERKLREKRLDMIVANAPRAIGAARSTVHIKMPGSEWMRIAGAPKARIAKRIITLAECAT